jgi:hypothetical protein
LLAMTPTRIVTSEPSFLGPAPASTATATATGAGRPRPAAAAPAPATGHPAGAPAGAPAPATASSSTARWSPPAAVEPVKPVASYDVASDACPALGGGGVGPAGRVARGARARRGVGGGRGLPHSARRVIGSYDNVRETTLHLATSSTKSSKWSVLIGRAGTKSD